MRTLIVIPLTIILGSVLGWMACAALGWNPHVREMVFAGAGCFVAAEMAIVPVILTRRSSAIAIAQACLGGSAIHLMGSVAIGGALMLIKSLALDGVIVYWLLGFYWITLVILVAAFIRTMKAMPSLSTPTAAGHS